MSVLMTNSFMVYSCYGYWKRWVCYGIFSYCANLMAFSFMQMCVKHILYRKNIFICIWVIFGIAWFNLHVNWNCLEYMENVPVNTAMLGSTPRNVYPHNALYLFVTSKLESYVHHCANCMYERANRVSTDTTVLLL